MKKTFSSFFIIFCTILTFAQAPQAFNYQGTARTADGKPVSGKTISVRISVLNGSASGPADYVETHSVQTNLNGLFALQVSTGNVVSGTFSQINWSSGSKFLKSEVDVNGGSAYTIVATTQLLSVPYALNAANGQQPGTNIGDMQYWNGTAWVALPVGTENQSLTICKGKPHWGPCPPPTIVLGSHAQVVNATSYTLEGFFDATKPGNVSQVTEYGFYFGEGPIDMTNASKIRSTTPISSNYTFSAPVSALKPATNYFYMAYAVHPDGEFVSEINTFTTESAVSLPSLTEVTVTSVLSTIMEVTGGYNNSQSSSVFGLLVSKNPDPELNGNGVISSPEFQNSIEFLYKFQNLEANTVYYTRSYGKNAAGTSYSPTVEFKTLPSTPSVNTNKAVEIRDVTATLEATFYPGGNTAPTSRGFIFHTTPNVTQSTPGARQYLAATTTGNKYVSYFRTLAPGITYYVKAFFVHEGTIYYGNEISFTTITQIEDIDQDGSIKEEDCNDNDNTIFPHALEICGDNIDNNCDGQVDERCTLTDIDGNVYSTVVIGSQTWMAENLKTTKLNDGTPLATGLTNLAWETTIIASYAVLNDDPAMKNKTGLLYNFYCVETNKLCPAGWRVPTIDDWTTFENTTDAYDHTTHLSINWMTPSISSSGFSAKTSGDRKPNGTYFLSSELETNWWAKEGQADRAYNYSLAERGHTGLTSMDKNAGYSIRCIKE